MAKPRVAAMITAGVLITASLSWAALNVGPTAAPARAAGLTNFTDCPAVEQWFTSQLRELAFATGTGRMPVDVAEEPSLPPTALGSFASDTPASTNAVGNGPTGTNVQETGVDEADIVKLRGGQVVTATSDALVIVDVTGAVPHEIGRQRLPVVSNLEPMTLLVSADRSGDRVVVIVNPAPDGAAPDVGVIYIPDENAPPPPDPVPWQPSVWTGVVDVSDPTSPNLLSSSEIQGSLIEARLSGDTVRVVTNYRPPIELPWQSWRVPHGWTPDEAAVDKALAGLSAEDFLPHLLDRDGAVQTTREPAVQCTDLAHPEQPSGSEVTTVSSIVPGHVSAGTDPVRERVALAAGGELVYAGPASLYVATNAGGGLWGFDIFAGPRSSFSGGGAPAARTEIHAFDTSTSGTTSYRASGTVAGSVIGRWAFSERDGVLRVATTRDLTGGSDPESSPVPDALPSPALSPGPEQPSPAEPRTDSAVTTLQQQGNRLVQVGEVTGLGKDEFIQSVRWFDSVAYVVTFRQTDPLYAVDLSDPANPRVTGELKIPGFSRYLHPIGDHRLVGVGSAADESGVITGLQVSTFDVSDPSAPRLIDSYTEDGAHSAVSQDSRAFSYRPETDTALIPSTGNGWKTVALSARVGPDGRLSVTEHEIDSAAIHFPSLQRLVPLPGGRVAGLVSGYDQTMTRPVTALVLLDDTLTTTGTLQLD